MGVYEHNQRITFTDEKTGTGYTIDLKLDEELTDEKVIIRRIESMGNIRLNKVKIGRLEDLEHIEID